MFSALEARKCVHRWTAVATAIGALLLAGCKEEIVPKPFAPQNAHEAYEHSLREAGLMESALGREWVKAAENALDSPVIASMPMKERIFLDEREAIAAGYRFEVRRGQKVEVSVERNGNTTMLLFVDVFRLDKDGTVTHIASADEQYRLAFEPRIDADYILRVQPELLRGGLAEITIRRIPAFGFPVAGAREHDIGSFFGDPRDGGRRKHHGIDIFARRHTPVIAPSDGYVRFAGERGRGGRVVWMRDTDRNMTVYFAHLHDILTEKGKRVEKGDTIGTVGNTGNARTTPPHLHFGIYHNGPVDPYYFVAKGDRTPEEITVAAHLLGSHCRLRSDHSVRRYHMSGETEKWKKHQLFQVVALQGNACRVRTPDGKLGYIASKEIELIDKPLDRHALIEVTPLLAEPSEDALIIKNLNGGTGVEVLGKNAQYVYVKDLDGSYGWMLAAP